MLGVAIALVGTGVLLIYAGVTDQDVLAVTGGVLSGAGPDTGKRGRVASMAELAELPAGQRFEPMPANVAGPPAPVRP